MAVQAIGKPQKEQEEEKEEEPHLKSSEILKSALTIFKSNIKFMLLMLLSIFPFFALMVFYEIKLQKTVLSAPNFLGQSPPSDCIVPGDFDRDRAQKMEFLSQILQLGIFYFVIYPLLELFSMITTIKLSSKIHTGEKQATFKEVFTFQKNKLKGLLITCFSVHFLSTLTLLGVFWIVANCLLFSSRFYNSYFYSFNSKNSIFLLDFCLNILSIGFHLLLFIALLYKYLDWSALWNMGMVISILEEETRIEALGLSAYYGKHCKRTGFELMLFVFVFGNALRLLCLSAGLCDESLGGVFVTAIVIGLFCLGNLVKWVACFLYYDDCKQQTLEKKVDKEVGKAEKKVEIICVDLERGV